MDPASVHRFTSPRGGSNSWAQCDENLDAWRRGAQLDVRPVTMEYAPILACDADCPLCPYKKSRDSHCKGFIPKHVFAAEDDIASSRWETARRILDRARAAEIRGVLFTGGGEPLKWRLLPEMLAYSYELGMVNGLYTNGFQLGMVDDLAHRLVAPDSGLVFVRLSINTVSARAAQVHWGLGSEEVTNQITGLARLVAARDRAYPYPSNAGSLIPSIQISTIVDKNTADDLPGICKTIAEVMQRRRSRGPEDVMVVRPLTIHGRRSYSANDHQQTVIDKIVASCGERGAGRQLLGAAGVRVFLGFGLDRVDGGTIGSYTGLVQLEYARRRVSLANGLFLTVSPDGSVFPATEYNCKSGWELGNLVREPVVSVWAGDRRRNVLDHFNQNHWGPSVSQPTARTNRLDMIAQAIMRGELDASVIARIREESYATPPLLLD